MLRDRMGGERMKWLWLFCGVVNGFTFWVHGFADGDWDGMRGSFAVASLLLADEIHRRQHFEGRLRAARRQR